jgi:hypothetical protein
VQHSAEPEVQHSAEPEAQHSAEPELLAVRAVARLPEESAARDVVAVPLRAAGHAGVAPEAARDAVVEPQREAEAWVAAAAPRPEARGAAGVRRREAAVQAAVAEVVLRLVGARDAAGVLRPAVPGAPAPARPSVVLSAFHRDRLRRGPAPSPAARLARAMASLRIASP